MDLNYFVQDIFDTRLTSARGRYRQHAATTHELLPQRLGSLVESLFERGKLLHMHLRKQGAFLVHARVQMKKNCHKIAQ